MQLPLFLHSRAAHDDFLRLLKARLHELPKRGLVHSFTGTAEEMKACVEMGFSMGVNGCSLKSEDNLAVVKEIPMDRLMIETDGPWVRCANILYQFSSTMSASKIHHWPYKELGLPKVSFADCIPGSAISVLLTHHQSTSQTHLLYPKLLRRRNGSEV